MGEVVEAATEQGYKEWLLLKLKPVHVEIARMAALGKAPKEIAEAVDFHPESIYRLLKTPLMKAEIARMRGNVDNILIEADIRMKSLVHRSLDVLSDVLGEPNIGVQPKGDLNQQTKVAFKVLDSVLELNKRHGGITLTNIQNIQAIINEAEAKSDQDLVKDVMARVKDSQK